MENSDKAYIMQKNMTAGVEKWMGVWMTNDNDDSTWGWRGI